jgi:short-subunit dehydrogenase
MKDIKGYNALVTGGTSGMGWEYCQQLAAKGCNILMVSIQQEQLEKLPKELTERYGVKAWGLYMDLSKDTAAREVWDYCQEQKIEIDILINNAGMFFFHELDPETQGKAITMLQLHIMTPTRLVMLFGEAMKERRRGYIIHVSSLAAKLPVPGITFYSATKAYLKSFSKSMYFEFRNYNVGCTTVLPGAIATPLYGLKPSLMKLGVNVGVISTPRWLVKRAISGMLHKRHYVKPGAMNYYLPVLIKLLPNWLEMKIWNKFRKK